MQGARRGNAVVLALLLPGVAAAAPAFVQAGLGDVFDDSTATTVEATLPQTTPGNSLVVAVSWDASTSSTASASDSYGNAGWVACTARQGPFTYNQYHQIFFLPLIAAGGPSHVVTITFSATSTFRRLVVHEVSGLDTSAATCDQSAVNNGDDVAPSAGPITPGFDGEYVFATAMNMSDSAQTFAPAAPFTERGTSLPGNGELQTQDWVQGQAAPVTAGWTYSASAQSFTAQIASFKAAPTAGQPALVQKARDCVGYSCGGSPGETFSVALPQPVTAGNTLVAFVYWTWIPSAPGAVLTDSQGNVWLPLAPVVEPASGTAGQLLYAPNVRGGTTAVTVSMGTCFDHAVGLAVLEYAGLARADPLDTSAGHVAPMSTPDASTPTLTTSSPNALLVAGFNDIVGTGTSLPGPGWTSQLTNTPFYMLVEDRLAPAPGMYTGTAVLPYDHASWIATIAAFRAEPDGGSDAGVLDAGPPDAGSPLLVQRARLLGTGTTLTLALPAPTTAGTHLIAWAYWEDGSDAGVLDTAGNAWTGLPMVTVPGSGSAQLFYATSGDAGLDTLVLTRGGSTGSLGVSLFEYAGIEPGVPFVSSANAVAPAVPTADATTPAVATLPDAGLLLFSAFFDPQRSGIAVPGPGWTRQACSETAQVVTQQRLVFDEGPYAGAATLAGATATWMGTIAAFRLAAGPDASAPDAGAPPVHQRLAVGCDCDASGGLLIWALLVLAGLGARRRR